MNPAKAPWYFLGLQEMLVYFDPWIAGVVMPTMIIIGLMVIPYIDTNPLGSGYYLRISADGHPTADEPLTIANGGGTFDQRLIVDPSFLELVRLGIRPPADPRIRSTLAVLDAVDRGDSRSGSGWYRYPHDGYGESTLGGPPDGHGHLWPLLSGERGVYAVLAGDDEKVDDAELG